MIYNKIVLKLTGQIFTSEHGEKYNDAQAQKIIQEIKPVFDQGAKIIIVIGAGNLFRGRDKKIPNFSEDKADKMGMLGTAMNGLYLQEALKCMHINARLFASTEMDYFMPYFTKETADKALEKYRLIIISCGIGKTRCTTDHASIAHALTLKAEAILKGTEVDGVFDRDPKLYKKVKFIPEISYKEMMKLEFEKIFDNSGLSIAIDKKIKIPTHIFNIFGKGNFLKIMEGEKIGSKIY